MSIRRRTSEEDISLNRRPDKPKRDMGIQPISHGLEVHPNPYITSPFLEPKESRKPGLLHCQWNKL
jgi:hypothetical protein